MMTVQRQYSLPNCVLILEGFNTDGEGSARPLLSVLTSFECHFANEAKIIKGGKELLQALAEQVHQQAQAILSGVSAISSPSTQAKEGLQLQALDSGLYSLKIESPALDIELSTVQLFDLVEAIDQLMDDSQTLPDLTLPLKPLSRRQVKSEGTGQKILPLILGVASLAIAGAVAYVIPVPEITKPKPPETESIDTQSVETESTESSETESSEPNPIDTEPGADSELNDADAISAPPDSQPE